MSVSRPRRSDPKTAKASSRFFFANLGIESQEGQNLDILTFGEASKLNAQFDVRRALNIKYCTRAQRVPISNSAGVCNERRVKKVKFCFQT